MAPNKWAYAAALIIVMVIAAVIISTTTRSVPPSILTPTSNVAVQLTDPPQAPAGTQALVINYSSLEVHLSNANNASGWISASGGGSVDLLAIVNLTQTIGTASIPANASINMVRFNVTSATIRINGTTYNVTVPSSKVTAHITGAMVVNGTAGILLDLSPTIASIVTNTSTVFVLVPSLRAVVVPGATNPTTLHVGAKVQLGENHTRALEETRLNISVTGASVSVSTGNVTHFSVVVRDNSNQSVVIKHVGFFGNESVHVNLTSIEEKAQELSNSILSHIGGFCTQVNSTLGINISREINATHTTFPANIISGEVGNEAGVHARPQIMSEAGSNSSENATPNSGASAHANISASASTGAGETEANASVRASAEAAIGLGEDEQRIASNIGLNISAGVCSRINVSSVAERVQENFANVTRRLEGEQEHLGAVVFSVQGNGTLTVPSGEEDFSNSGMTIAAGQSVTLHFDGVIEMGDGHLVIVPLSGSTYKVGVQGEEFARVAANITAT